MLVVFQQYHYLEAEGGLHHYRTVYVHIKLSPSDKWQMTESSLLRCAHARHKPKSQIKMAECSTSTSSSGRNLWDRFLLLRKNVSRPVRFEEEFGYSCFKKEKASEDDTGKKNKHYYDCSIVSIDTEKKKVLVHYTGFPQNCKEWKKYDDDSFPVVKREPYFVPGDNLLRKENKRF